MHGKLILISPVVCWLTAGCASPSRTNTGQLMVGELQRTTPTRLIQKLGPPAQIAFNKTMFGYGAEGWVKGAQEYSYYFRNGRGQIGLWQIYYKDQHWLATTWTIDPEGFRRLDPAIERDSKAIAAYEASHSALIPPGT